MSKRHASGRLRATPARRGNPGGVGPSLRSTSSPSRAVRRARPRAARRPVATRSRLGRLADPEHDRSSWADERQAPLGGDRRRRERLRDRDAGPVGLLLLGAAPDDPGVRRRPALEEVALPALRLEQHELVPRQRERERDARRAAARADVDDRALEPAQQLDRPQRVLEQDARARPRGESAVSPGVATTARSQSSSEPDRRRRSDAARPPRSPSHAVVVLQPLVHEPALGGAHRLELDPRCPRAAPPRRARTASASSVRRRRSR